MVSLDRLKRYIFGSVIGSLPLMFGSYLMYDRIFLAISTGQTEVRAGLLDRASEPVSFWISVIMYGFFGGAIAWFGLWCLWRTFRAR